MRDDRDRLLSQVQILTTDAKKYKESTQKYSAELDILTTKVDQLEVDLPVSEKNYSFYCLLTS